MKSIKTKKKHVGLDDYWLAISLQKVNLVEELPRMVVSFTIEELKEFFNNKVNYLMKEIQGKDNRIVN